MLSKGDKVSGSYKGKPFNAIITKVLRGGEKCHFTTVGFEGGDKTLIGPDRGLKPASFEGSLPEEPKGPILHVGDHVTTEWKGEIVKGVISKVGPKKVEMRFWQKADGQGIKGHPSFFKLAQHELPEDPAAAQLADWEVRNYHYYARMSEETPAFSADIFYMGNKVFRAGNHGTGGPNQYDPYDHRLAVKLDALEAKMHEVFTSIFHNDRCAFDVLDTWVEWYVNDRPYGITLEAYIKDAYAFLFEKAPAPTPIHLGSPA